MEVVYVGPFRLMYTAPGYQPPPRFCYWSLSWLAGRLPLISIVHSCLLASSAIFPSRIFSAFLVSSLYVGTPPLVLALASIAWKGDIIPGVGFAGGYEVARWASEKCQLPLWQLNISRLSIWLILCNLYKLVWFPRWHLSVDLLCSIWLLGRKSLSSHCSGTGMSKIPALACQFNSACAYNPRCWVSIYADLSLMV